MTTLNAIRTLTIRSTTEGFPASIGSLKELKDAFEKFNRSADENIKITDKVAKSQLSLKEAFEKQERRFNTALRAQQDFEKVQRQVNAAVAQNPALQERANVVLALAQKHFSNASQGGQAYGRAMEAVQAQAAMLSGRLGVLGTVLTGLGPAGIAVAASIGAAAIAMKLMSDAALQLADRAGKLKDFSETTGFTVLQLQALEKAGAQVGVSAESVNKGLEKFSVSMEAAKQSSGPLYEALLRVNPALAGQIARTDSLAEAWDLLATATRKADLEQRNFIARQAFGRSGIELTRLLGSTAQAGGLKGLIGELKQVDLITAQQAERWDTLGDKINENMKAAKQNIDATFTGPVLESLLQFSNGLLEISRIIRDTDWSKLEIAFQGLSKVLTAMFPLLNAAAMSLRAIQSFGLQAPTAGSSPLQLTVTPGGGDQQAQADAAKKMREEIIRSAAEMKRYMDVLGEAATPAEKLRMKQLDLAAAVAKNGDVSEAARRNLANYNEELARGNLSRRVGMLGELASISEIVKNKQNEINKAIEDGVNISEKEQAALLEKTRVQAAARIPENQVQFEREILFLSQEEAQIRQQLIAWGIDYNSVRGETLAQEMRIIDIQRSVFNGAKDFVQTFASGILDGKDAVDALVSSLDQLAKKLLSSGIDDLFKGAIKGAMTGDWTQAVMGSVQIIGAFLIDMFADETKAQQEAKKKLQEAREQWREMKDRFQDFIASMSGESVGSLTKALRDAEKQMQDFIDAALKAGDYAAARQAQEAFQKFRQDQINEFKATWEAMLQAFDLGLGLDNPFVTAAQKVRDLAKQLKGFIDDTKTAFAIPIMHGDKIVGTTTIMGGGASPEEIARATTAVRNYLLTLLSGGAELSDTQKRLMEIQGTAQQLASTLQELGMSAADAAVAISNGVVAAISKLRTAFEADLRREINDASGQGFINEITDLIAKRNQRTADVVALGADAALVQRAFEVSAQRVIDNSGLVGEAFDNLVSMFPDLTGVVRESTKALEDQKRAEEERQRALDQTARGIVDYVNSLLTGSNSTMSPQAKLAQAQATYNSQLALAQGGNIDALGSITKYFEDYRSAARDVYASSTAYQNILNTGIAQLLALPAVSQSTDPVVSAIRDSILEMQKVTENTGATAANTNDISQYIGTGDQSGLRLLVSQMAGYIGSGDTVGLRKLVSDVSTYIGSGDQSGLRKLVWDMAGYIGSGDTAGLRKLVSDVSSNIGTGDSQGVRKLLADVSSYIGSGDNIGLRNLVNNVATYIGNNDTSGMRKLLDDVGTYIGAGDSVGLRNLVTNVGTYLGVNDSSGLRKLTSDAALNTGTTATKAEETATNIGANDSAGMRGVLALLKANFDQGAYTTPGVPGSHGGTTIGSDTVNNNMLTALNKIVYNTRQTTRNLQIMLDNGNTYGAIGGVAGVLATGGWIRGGIPGVDSVPILAMQNEYMVQESATRALTARYGAGIMDTINAGQLPTNVIPFPTRGAYGANDNGELLFEIRRLNARVESLERTLADGLEGHARAGREDAGAIVGAVNDTGKKNAEAIRMSGRSQRVS